MKVNVLGTTYTIYERDKEKEVSLANCDGWCDKTTKTICIMKKPENQELCVKDWSVFRAKLLRHEIIHAFLFESGLHENWQHNEWGHDETFLDWFAVQYPKLSKAFESVGCSI